MIINNNINSLLNLPQDTTSVQDKKPVSVEIKSTSSETRYTGSTEKELLKCKFLMAHIILTLQNLQKKLCQRNILYNEY